ncbi:MAG: hypothetical protein K6C05_09230, partial [Anaerovibrio sp.]|uniref:ADP-ribosyltransferase-containing protein n=1 Tax=Anaerovibrio sp. TaxID=1872532 RepID=UPI0025F7B493
ESSDYAEAMAEERNGNTIYDVFLNIKNPLILELPENRFSDPNSEKPYIKQAKEQENDGVAFKNNSSDGFYHDVFYVAFEPTQIKSATDNNGNYDANDPNIYHQVDGGSFSAENSEAAEINKYINSKAIPVESKVFVGDEKQKAHNKAVSWFREKFGTGTTVDTVLGEVTINYKGIKASLNHRYSQKKLDCVASIVDGMKQASYIKSIPDYDNPQVTNHFFVYKVTYEGKENFVLCRVKEQENVKRFYIHEVGTAEEIKLKSGTLQTRAGGKNHPTPRGIALYTSILSEFSNKIKKQMNGYLQNSDSNTQPVEKFYHSAWHGSLYDFDEFDIGAIGNGQGGAVHGWGLYFANKKQVSEKYRKSVIAYKNKETGEMLPTDITNAALEIEERYGHEKAIEVIQKSINNDPDATNISAKRQMLEFLANKDNYEKTKGRLYKVDIPNDKDLIQEENNYLNQSKTIQKKMAEAVAISRSVYILMNMV